MPDANHSGVSVVPRFGQELGRQPVWDATVEGPGREEIESCDGASARDVVGQDQGRAAVD
jgi:hypothetical protein